MSKTNTFEADSLSHVLNNATIALVGDATGLRGSTAAGSLYLSLHTADPGEGGDQTTSEIAYTSYVRFPVARSGALWTVSGTAPTQAVLASPPAAFAAGTGGTGTASFFGLGTDVSGAGKLLYKGAISPSIVCGNGITPRISPTITED